MASPREILRCLLDWMGVCSSVLQRDSERFSLRLAAKYLSFRSDGSLHGSDRDLASGQGAQSLYQSRYGRARIYFPLPYAVLRAVEDLRPQTVLLIYFAVTFGSVLAIWIWWLRRQRRLWRGDSRWPVVIILTFVIVVCNYPMFFAVDRGNLDPLAMCLMYAAIGLVAQRRRVLGGLMLALASASKGIPFAAVLYWIRRRYVLALTVAACGFAASILGSAAAFQGGVAVTLTLF